jgi:hypothetical protein
VLPIGPTRQFVSDLTVCVTDLGATPVAIAGAAGRIRLEYQTPSESWWSQLGEINRRLMVGRASLLGSVTGPLIVLVELLVVALAVGVAWTAARRPGRRA